MPGTRASSLLCVVGATLIPGVGACGAHGRKMQLLPTGRSLSSWEDRQTRGSDGAGGTPQALVVERGTERGGPLLEEGQRGWGRTGRVGVCEVEGNSEQKEQYVQRFGCWKELGVWVGR